MQHVVMGQSIRSRRRVENSSAMQILWKVVVFATPVIVVFLYCSENSSITRPSLLYDEKAEELNYRNTEYILGLREFQDKPWSEDEEPNGLYEATRHRLHEQIKELWTVASHELKTAIAEPDHNKRNETLKTLLVNLERRENMLLVEQQRLASVDGYAEWRERAAIRLSELVQRRLRELQNPPDCAATKKLICNIGEYNCGFGCQLQHFIYCLRAAYATGRTAIVGVHKWPYEFSWDSLFMPLSDNCTVYDVNKAVDWPGLEESSVMYLKLKEPYQKLPLGVPKDLAYRIMSFNGDPAAWFLAQLLKYVLRPKEHFQKTIDKAIARLNYPHPIVGMHIRRTDKLIWEAKFHAIQEYMDQAEKFWVRRDLARELGDPPTPRRVYLACDDVTVFETARRMYPSVEFYGDEDFARTASVKSRLSLAAITGVVVDILLLSRTDYLVCTFSSSVGKAAYELMQTNRVDASESYFSLDVRYRLLGRYDSRITLVNTIEKLQETSSNKHQSSRLVQLPWFETEKVPVLYNYPEYQKVHHNNV